MGLTPEQAQREQAIRAQERFDEEYAREQGACCPAFAIFGYHGFGCDAPRDYCCQGQAQGRGHDGTCPERFSRSGGS